MIVQQSLSADHKNEGDDHKRRSESIHGGMRLITVFLIKELRMRANNGPTLWPQIRGKKRPYSGILTLNDLPKTNPKYRQLVAKIEARNLAAKMLSAAQPEPKTDDFAI
jgi:hypothetical protein